MNCIDEDTHGTMFCEIQKVYTFGTTQYGDKMSRLL